MSGTEPGPPAPQPPATGVVVRVALDPTALAEPAAGDPALLRSVHEDLLESLVLHGRVVLAGAADLAAFRSALRSLPSSVAKLWEALLTSGRLRLEVLDPPAASVVDALDAGPLEESLAGRVDLVLLDRTRAELLGVPPSAFSVTGPAGQVELGRLATAARTRPLRRADLLLDAPLREGDNRELVWQARFEPLVAATGAITVYDRYAGINAVRRFLFEAPSADGLTWFLGKVAMRPGRHVRLITAVPEDEKGRRIDADTVAGGLQRLVASLGERQVRLEAVLVPNGRGRFGHDRHIRFGERVALALGPGLQAFSRPRLSETVVVARLPITDAKQRERDAVKAQLRPPPYGWL